MFGLPLACKACYNGDGTPEYDAPPETTEQEGVPETRAPVDQPTSAPATEPPVAPTEAPVAPTEAPVAPTEAPVAATDAPVAPTQAPVADRQPVAATDAPVAPTQAPVADKQPVAATDAPVAPTQAPVAATDAPVAPTEAPVAPTEAPVADRQPVATEPPAAAPTVAPATPEPTTAQPVDVECTACDAAEKVLTPEDLLEMENGGLELVCDPECFVNADLAGCSAFGLELECRVVEIPTDSGEGEGEGEGGGGGSGSGSGSGSDGGGEGSGSGSGSDRVDGGGCSAAEEAACADISPAQQEALANYDNGGKIIVCDPTCEDKNGDPMHCNCELQHARAYNTARKK